MVEKLIQKYQIWDHTGSIQKQPSGGKPETDSISEERNPDQKWSEIETYKFAWKVVCKSAVQLWNMKSSERLW